MVYAKAREKHLELSANEVGIKPKWSLAVVISSVIIMLNSGYALTVGNVRAIPIISAVFLAALFMSYSSSKTVRKRDFGLTEKIILLLIFSIVLAFVINVDNAAYREYMRIGTIIGCAFFLSKIITLDEFVYYFTRLMRLVTFISLILFELLKSGFITLPVINNEYGFGYYTAYIFSARANTEVLRNSAVFWEAGLFAAFIMLALIIEIILAQKSKTKLLVYAMYFYALISAGSTAAYLYIIFAVLIMISNKVDRFWNTALFLVAITGLFYFFFNYDQVINNLAESNPAVFGKLVQENTSLTDRLNNPIADFLVCWNKPFGVGVGNVTRYAQFYAFQRFGVELSSRTSTLTYFFAAFGFLGGAVYNYAWIKGISGMEKVKWLTKLAVVIAIIALASASPLSVNMTFWLFIFILLKSKKGDKEEKTNKV